MYEFHVGSKGRINWVLSVSEEGRRSWRLTPCVEFGFSNEPSGSGAEVLRGSSAAQQSLGEPIRVRPATAACKSSGVRMPAACVGTGPLINEIRFPLPSSPTAERFPPPPPALLLPSPFFTSPG